MRMILSGLLAASFASGAGASASASAKSNPITHVVIIMQENRSFDSYFGTFKGANGLPAGTCVPLEPSKPTMGCVAPFHDPHDVNAGGPHSPPNAQNDLDDGITTVKQDGYVKSQTHESPGCARTGISCTGLKEGIARHDVMGYHDAEELPNYWAYAQHFVLQDNMFAGVRSSSYPAHLDMTSEWVAQCSNPKVASTCVTTTQVPQPNPSTLVPWANLFQLLDVHGVSWKYYLGEGDAPDCADGEMDCPPSPQNSTVRSLWNPAPYYTSVQANGSAYLKLHNPAFNQFYADVAANALPQVSWIVPSNSFSEHPAAGVTAGMEYVTGLVNAIANSPYWYNTAIFISWDDWGGFYDHVVPPVVDTNNSRFPVQGFGIRVPGILVSAWAKPGRIDHSLLSNESYTTFFEDLFMDGARLNPSDLGNPDSRPDIRDALTSVTFPDGSMQPVGDLMQEFNFKQTPLPPLILSSHIPTGIKVACSGDLTNNQIACTQQTVTIEWMPVTNPQVPGPLTYHVTRDGKELASCVTTAASCTDTPRTGAHLYRAYTVDSSGTVSPSSAAAEADVP